MPQGSCGLRAALAVLLMAGGAAAVRHEEGEGRAQQTNQPPPGSQAAVAPSHHGPLLGTFFSSMSAALSAGALLASEGLPGFPARGPPTQAAPPEDPIIFEETGYGRMMQVAVPMPEWCTPCKMDAVDFYVGASLYKLPIRDVVHAGDTVLAYVPVPAPAEQIEGEANLLKGGWPVDSKLFCKKGNVLIHSLQVPEGRKAGDLVRTWCPSEGGAGKEAVTLVVPRGVQYPNSLIFECNPKAKQAARTARAAKMRHELVLLRDYRCCCEGRDETQTNCLWFPNRLLKTGGHCPRVQTPAAGGGRRCTADFCYPWATGECVTMHHPYAGGCEITSLEEGPQYFFHGDACGGV